MPIACSWSPASIWKRAREREHARLRRRGARVGDELLGLRECCSALVAVVRGTRPRPRGRPPPPPRLRVADGEQRFARLLERILPGDRRPQCGVTGPAERAAPGARGRRPAKARLPRRSTSPRSERVESGRAVAGFAEGEPSAVREIGGVPPGGAGELERRVPVVGEHLGVVVRPSERLDPLGDAAVLLGAVGAGDLPVGDVANEGVRERELGLALDGRAPLAAHEPLALQRVERRRAASLTPSRTAPPRRPCRPRRRRAAAPSRLGEPVETGGDDALERLREAELVGEPRSRKSSANCSAYSGLPPARSSSACWDSAGSTDRSRSCAMSSAVCVLAERRERERRRVRACRRPSRAAARAAPAAPLRRPAAATSVTQSTSSSTKSSRLSSAQCRSSNTSDERPLLGHRLEEAAPGGERLAAAVVPSSDSAASPTSERSCDSTQVASPVSASTSATARRASARPRPACPARGCRPAP